jgi:signal transduction histidine kinase
MFDLDSALMTALAEHSAAAAENGVNMLSVVGNVPSQVTGDAGNVPRVLDALLTNAVDFTITGKIILHVWIETASRDEPELDSADDAFLCFTVIDTGIEFRKTTRHSSFYHSFWSTRAQPGCTEGWVQD